MNEEPEGFEEYFQGVCDSLRDSGFENEPDRNYWLGCFVEFNQFFKVISDKSKIRGIEAPPDRNLVSLYFHGGMTIDECMYFLYDR